MLDYANYITEDNHYQGNGYDQLQGDWALYYKVAKGFARRTKLEDRQDFLHTAMLQMARVKAKYDVIGKLLTEAGLVRIANYEVADYWRKRFKRINGIDCSHCTKEQKEKCRDWDLYRECPKAIRMESLYKVIEDGDGNQIEFYQMIADDNAVDIVARLDARHILQGYPHKFVRIAYKKYSGLPLDKTEARYYQRQRQKVLRECQKVLI